LNKYVNTLKEDNIVRVEKRTCDSRRNAHTSLLVVSMTDLTYYFWNIEIL